MSASQAAQTLNQDSGSDSGASSPSHDSEAKNSEETITKQFLMEQLDVLTQKLLTSWTKSFDSLKKDVQEMGTRILHVEEKMEEYMEAHNNLADHGQAMEEKVQQLENKLIDLEDRARWNSLHIRASPKN
ncbi:Hypothetical predicted protein [Pelobates cultripes]|uniref:Uncharacterized protein n=1 Tax=Pelobates cultripes TaxID=61616 RepID=A0AAD1R3K7_PELCU|nr:Hypothetical predicted protein [Pelobates cultripes]